MNYYYYNVYLIGGILNIHTYLNSISFDIQKDMTIVRPSPSSKIQKRSSFQIKKTPNTMKSVDVFSNSQLPGLKNKENYNSEIESEYNSDEQDGDEIDIYSHTVTDNNKYKYKESESQEPK